MHLSRERTGMLVMIAVLWLVIMFLGWQGQFVAAMVLGVILMLLHMMLGVAHKGKLSKKFFIYPLLSWSVLWILSFILSKVFSDKFAGMMPTFTVTGLHPSFAPTFYLYWFGGMLTLSLGMYILQDHWLSQEQWAEFVREVNTDKEETNV